MGWAIALVGLSAVALWFGLLVADLEKRFARQMGQARATVEEPSGQRRRGMGIKGWMARLWAEWLDLVKALEPDESTLKVTAPRKRR